MSSSSSPCAACKFLQRNYCTQECVFAPYFPADQPQRFSNVHHVFGASNVEEMLNGISPQHRKDAANSLAYEAGMRVIDPVNGAFGKILALQEGIRKERHDLEDLRTLLEGIRKIRHNLEVLKRKMASNVVPAATAVVAGEASLGHNAATTSGVQMGAEEPTEAGTSGVQMGAEEPTEAGTSGVQMGADEPTEAGTSGVQMGSGAHERHDLEDLRTLLEGVRKIRHNVEVLKRKMASNVVPAATAIVAGEASLGHNAATTSGVQMGAAESTEAGRKRRKIYLNRSKM